MISPPEPALPEPTSPPLDLQLDGHAALHEPWQPPVPLDGPPLPPFPADALPAWLRDFVLAQARATQTPADLPAVLALAVLSAVCARRVEVNPWGDWREPVNLFALVVLPPGHRAGAVLAALARPILDRELAPDPALDPAIARAEAELAVDQQGLRYAQKHAAAYATEPGPFERLRERAALLAERIARQEVPTRPRLLVDDCTPERLVALLQAHGGRLAVLSPNGGLFDLLTRRYGSSATNLDYFLKGHAGDPIVLDRAGRPSILIARPAITIAVAAPPEALRDLLARPAFRARGLPARFLYALPPGLLGRREVDPPPVPPAVRDRYHHHLTALLGAAQTAAEPGLLAFTPPAREQLREFLAALEPRLGEEGDLVYLVDWAAGLASLVVRLVGLLHLAARVPESDPADTAQQPDANLAPPASDAEAALTTPASPPPEPVAVDTIRAACAIGHYAIAHARAAYTAGGHDPLDDARCLLRAIRALGQPEVSHQQIWQATRSRFRHARALDAPLLVLVERGYLRERPAPSRTLPDGSQVRGRKPAPTFLLHPRLTPAPAPSGTQANCR